MLTKNNFATMLGGGMGIEQILQAFQVVEDSLMWSNVQWPKVVGLLLRGSVLMGLGWVAWNPKHVPVSAVQGP